MIIQRLKNFAYIGGAVKRIVSDKDIAKSVAREVAKSTEYIKTHPFDPGLLREKKVKRISIFSTK